MRIFGHVAMAAGAISLVLCVVSRLTMEPIVGVEAHAIIEFTQAALLLAIALYVGEELKA